MQGLGYRRQRGDYSTELTISNEEEWENLTIHRAPNSCVRDAPRWFLKPTEHPKNQLQ